MTINGVQSRGEGVLEICPKGDSINACPGGGGLVGKTLACAEGT